MAFWMKGRGNIRSSPALRSEIVRRWVYFDGHAIPREPIYTLDAEHPDDASAVVIATDETPIRFLLLVPVVGEVFWDYDVANVLAVGVRVVREPQ